MSRIKVPDILAKVGLAPHKSRLHLATAAGQSVLPQMITMAPAVASSTATKHGAFGNSHVKAKHRQSFFKRGLEFMHAYSLGVFAILFLIVAVSGIQVGSAYWTAHRIKPILTSSSPAHHHVVPVHGPNIAIAAGQLPATLQQITAQPINLVIGDKTVPVDSTTIKSWLHIVTDKDKNTAYIHVNENAITSSLNQITAKFAKGPVDQVTTTYQDGTSAVIVAGREGVSVGDPKELAKQLSPNVLGGKGMQLNVPLKPIAFQSVTPTAFDKLIEVNVNTHQMYLYDKGQFTRQYAISAGAPSTPTPLGQFKIYSKPTVQTMTGLNADGSKYIQPNVHWINYFLPGGYAIHGNYWRPLNVFGTVNTSHGCVSLPDDQAQWVYDWAPIGTTVITHA